MSLTPLLLLLALGNRGGGGSMPMWPTAASPPPPPMPPLPAHPAESGTPLSHLAQPQPEPAPGTAKPPRDKKVKVSPAAAAKAAAKRLALNRGKSIFQRAIKAGPPAPTQTNVAVLSLQNVLARRGYAIKKDGLYGPKTASAWQALSNASKLSPMISRVGPKMARVARDTYTKLSIP